MELFRNVKIQWMKYKWAYLIGSWAVILVGWFSVWQKGFKMSVDLKGGTIVNIRFVDKPDVDKVRDIFKQRFPEEFEEVSRFGNEDENRVRAKLKMVKTEEKEQFQNIGSRLYGYLKTMTGDDKSSAKLDINNIGRGGLALELERSRKTLENLGFIKPEDGSDRVRAVCTAISDAVTNYKNDIKQGGLIRSMDDLKSLELSLDGARRPFPEPMIAEMKGGFYAGSFNIISIDSVGPTFGAVQQSRVRWAVVLSVLAMLVYIAFRFKLAYGVGASIAIVHDVLVTLGLMSLFDRELSLTVIAALLTLIGYSVNDTIVVFDRIRENLKKSDERNRPFSEVIDRAVNQTLSRTIITSGLTFISVFCLLLLGGETLNGFSFVLTVGIVVGTYSSIAIASPIMYWWMKHLGREKEKKQLRFA